MERTISDTQNQRLNDLYWTSSHTVDTTMRDRFGVVPSISFAEGLKRLSAHLA